MDKTIRRLETAVDRLSNRKEVGFENEESECSRQCYYSVVMTQRQFLLCGPPLHGRTMVEDGMARGN